VLVTEADGTIRAPEGPGIGVTIVADRVERATLRKETLA
jgi:L-alanine-DL-glutamate epimerase-like enolase superfamily enzyme